MSRIDEKLSKDYKLVLNGCMSNNGHKWNNENMKPLMEAVDKLVASGFCEQHEIMITNFHFDNVNYNDVVSRGKTTPE